MQNFITENKSIVIVLVILIVFGFIISFLWNNKFSVTEDKPFDSSRLNILVAGYDSEMFSCPRADTIILASIDLENNGIGLLFIPRDSRVEIPGEGMNRINSAHAYGGIELLEETVENFLDIPVDYYVETDFQGFARIIDRVGGVELEIEERLQYVDEAADLNINLSPGKRELNGEEALQYVRYRGKTKGDIGRVERQQKFLRALISKIMNPKIVVKLPGMYSEFKKSVDTNIPFKDITPFVHFLKGLDLEQIKSEIVPGEPEYINEASYWIPEKEDLNILVNNLIRSKEYIENNSHHISLYNGNGSVGLATELSRRLKKYGFNIDTVANAERFDHKTSLIKYYDSRDKTTATGIQNLIGGEIQRKKSEDEDRNIEIIIGKDYERKGVDEDNDRED